MSRNIFIAFYDPYAQQAKRQLAGDLLDGDARLLRSAPDGIVWPEKRKDGFPSFRLNI